MDMSHEEFFVSDCAQFENKIVTSSFVVVSKQVKPKSGEPYLALLWVIQRARRSQDVGQRRGCDRRF
jgi:hypothetical protein